MEIQTNELEYCKLNVVCLSSKEELDSKRIEVLDIFKRAPVPGHRKNKATLETIKYFYKTQIDESLKRAMAESCYHETLFQRNVKPVANPEFKLLELNKDNFKCEFVLYTQPQFNLNKYKEFEVPKPHMDISPEDMYNKFLQELREKAGTSEPFSENDFVQQGDSVIVDYDCFKDDSLVQQLSTKGDVLTVGKNLPTFDENLMGMKIGETKEFLYKVPENTNSEFKGDTVKFCLTLISGSKNSPHPIDDELAKRYGAEDLQGLEQSLQMVASKQYEDTLNAKKIEQVTALLLDTNKFEVPSWLSLYQAQYSAASNKLNWESLPDDQKTSLLNAAVKSVQLSLILEKIREEEPDCQLSDEEILKILQDNISQMQNGKSFQETLDELNKNKLLPLVMNRMKDEHTLNFVIKSCTFVE